MRAHNQDIQNLYSDIQSDALPSVSIVKPDGFLDGHPASSKFELFESFTKKIINMAQANPQLWADTAIMITVDEGGGYYDSGYVQPIDCVRRRDAYPDAGGITVLERRRNGALLY